jgi:hypothetical protein
VGVARVPEVTVTVDEDEPVASAASERQHVSEQDAAVAAEHDREAALIEQRRQTVGQSQTEALDRRLVADAVAGRPLGEVPRRYDDTAVGSPEPLEEPLVAQRPGELVDAWDRTGVRRAQAEVRRGVDNDDLSPAGRHQISAYCS